MFDSLLFNEVLQLYESLHLSLLCVSALFRQMMTPSWDSIRASSWRTLTRLGFAPMTCSAWRCTILVKRPMASRREVGEGGGWGSALMTPEPVNQLFILHTQEKQLWITAVNHRKHAGIYCTASTPEMTCFFTESPHIHLTLFLRQPAWWWGTSISEDARPGQKRINLTSGVWNFQF